MGNIRMMNHPFNIELGKKYGISPEIVGYISSAAKNTKMTRLALIAHLESKIHNIDSQYNESKKALLARRNASFRYPENEKLKAKIEIIKANLEKHYPEAKIRRQRIKVFLESLTDQQFADFL